MQGARPSVPEKVDGRMSKAAYAKPCFAARKPHITLPIARETAGTRSEHRALWATVRNVVFAIALISLFGAAATARVWAQAECLACHADKDMKDAAGHSLAVGGDKFGASIHGSLTCNACHADIKTYPHPDKIARVQCSTCHA